ncbi:MAG: MmgE/PrpD family protein [Candidatus Pacebacteria bacterium]|nr:MmgE/PrpD family protein [Candidatus Paceibacterota bacterium]
MTDSKHKTLTGTLAKIAIETDPDAIPESAFAAARKVLLDSLGCGLAGCNAPGVREALNTMQDWGGTPQAGVLFHGDQLPAPNAAFVNSTMIHALDYDDVYIPGVLHITSIIVPTALAVSQQTGASGRDFLAAIIIGIEVAGRLGIPCRDRRRGAQGTGFLPTSVVGGFGAAAAACRLRGLNIEQCVHAMGLNYAQVSGNRQALLDMSLTKRLQPGFAARSAIWSVALAEAGLTGPHRALEGDAGLFRIYQTAAPCTRDDLTAPREQMEIERVSLKRYTSCGACHEQQMAAEEIVATEKLRPEQIERVELYGGGPGGLVGQPFEITENPQVCAQFSVQYCVALALLRGQASIEYVTDEQVLANRDVTELAKSITFTDRLEKIPPPPPLPPDYSEQYVNDFRAVIVHTRDGRRLVRGHFPAEVFAPGNMSMDEVKEKFRQCAAFSGVCSKTEAGRLIQAVEHIAEISNIEASELLQFRAPARTHKKWS